MFSGFESLDVGVLGRVLRHTMVSSLIVGTGGVLIALLLSAPLASIGIGIGLAVAILNLRFLSAGVVKTETKGVTNKKALRRILATHSATRLLVITAIAVGLMFIEPPLGIGMVIGLVIFQVVFVLNVGRAIVSAGVL